MQHRLKVNFNQQPIGNSNFGNPRKKTEIKILEKQIKKCLRRGVIKEANNETEGERYFVEYFFDTKTRWYL